MCREDFLASALFFLRWKPLWLDWISSQSSPVADTAKFKMLKLLLYIFDSKFFSNLSSDVRLRDKILMGSPLSLFAVLVCYVGFSKILMHHKQLRNMLYSQRMIEVISFVYNLYASICSIYFVLKLVKYMIWSNFNFRCMSVDLSERDGTIEVR